MYEGCILILFYSFSQSSSVSPANSHSTNWSTLINNPVIRSYNLNTESVVK
jgi:hypothetical protein